MGEVGVNPAESTNSTAMKVNGDTNGAAPTGNAPVANCSADVEEIEDTSQEDSQDTQDTIQSNAKAASIDDEMDTEATSQDEEASCDNDSVKEVSAHNGDSVQKMETGEDDTQESSITNEKSRDGMENGTASSGSSASDSEKIDDDDEESNMNDENLDAKEVKSKNETTDALKNPLIKLNEKSQESSNSADTDSSAKELTSKLDSSLEITKVDKVVSAPASKENGHTVVRKPPLIINDDNDAILLSDSDDDDPPPPTKSITNGNDVVHEIESDKEDCVVVEDDKRDSLSPRRSGRSRKSAVKVREFSTFDDDIEEVIEDPLQLPAAKKPRMSPSSLNQITMKDARSLLDSNETYQQQFIQANNKKEPRLVIIDTNSIMSRGGGSTTMQAIQKQSGFSVTPVQHSPQMQITPTFNANANAQRPGLVPIGMSTTQKSTILQQTVQQPVVGLFPGLTDDMHVLEAPSFIVPYIYEKPPTLVLSDVVAKIGVELDEMKKKEAKEEKDVKKATTVKDDAEASTSKTVGAKAVSSEAKSSKKSRKSKTQNKTGDESWDESDTSTDEEASDTEERTKVLIKEATEDLEVIKTHIIGTPELIKETIVTPTTASADLTKKSENYFESALGKFFMDIGINLVQEHVQSDLLRQQKRRRNRDGTATPPNIQMAINSLMKNLEISRETNEPFKFDMKRCEYCNFKSESALAMANHYETPHMKKYGYKCNFCTFDSRSPQDIVFHMEAVHNVKGQLERPLSYHQCPNCPFEDNGKAKLSRHALFCAKKYRPELNMAPPSDWEPPAKIPRVKPRHGLVGTATAYQVSMQNRNMNNTITSLPRGMTVVNATANTNTVQRNRGGKQNQMTRMPANVTGIIRNNQQMQQQPMNMKQLPGITMSGLSVTSNYQMAANSYLQSASSMANKNNKAGQQPSISITPLPRTTNVTNQSIGHNLATISAMSNAVAAGSSNKGANASGTLKPGQSPTGAKANFVICEICDGYIKDLDQLRNHMQWMHKVKIHPKMIYNRPPLNCQKCQFRFFTDQGLERHLLGSHGLVTSSMQDAANKGKDAGRCPVCGRMYQWKLLNHVSRDHAMTLKPAHLSYKCTVCTATFGMYKQFENHVYSAHNTIAKKAMDKKSGGSSSSAPSSNTNKLNNLVSGDSLLKPIKINDEITIIPQPATLKNNLRTSSSTTITPISNNHTVIDISGGSSTRRQHRKQTKNSIQKIQK